MSGKVYVQWFLMIKGEVGNGKRRGWRRKGRGVVWGVVGGMRVRGMGEGKVGWSWDD